MKTINSKVSSGLSRSLANLVDLFSKKTAYTLSRLAFVSTLAAAGSSPLMAKTPIGASHDVRFNSAPSRDSNLLSFTKLGIDPLHSDHIQFGGTETFELTKNTLEKHEEKYLGDLDWHRFIRQYVFNDLQKTKDYLINKEMLITGYVNKKPVEIKIHYDQEKDIFVSQEKYLPKNLDVVDGKIAVLTIQNKNLNNFSVYFNFLPTLNSSEKVVAADKQSSEIYNVQLGGFMIWPLWKWLYVGSETFGVASLGQKSSKTQVESTGANSVGQKGESTASLSNYKVGQQTTLGTSFWAGDLYFQTLMQHYVLAKFGKDNISETDQEGLYISAAKHRAEIQQEIGFGKKFFNPGYEWMQIISAIKLNAMYYSHAQSLGSMNEHAGAWGASIKDLAYSAAPNFFQNYLTYELLVARIFGFKNDYMEKLADQRLINRMGRDGIMYGILLALNGSNIFKSAMAPTVGLGANIYKFPGDAGINNAYELLGRVQFEKGDWAMSLNADYRNRQGQAELNAGITFSTKFDFLKRPFIR